jgi:hypothetical protein
VLLWRDRYFILQHFDTDDSGFITREELAVALREQAADGAQLDGDIDTVLAQVITCQGYVQCLQQLW